MGTLPIYGHPNSVSQLNSRNYVSYLFNVMQGSTVAVSLQFSIMKKIALISTFIAHGPRLYLLIAADTEALVKIKDSATSG